VEIDQGELDAGVDLHRILAMPRTAAISYPMGHPRAEIGGRGMAQAGSDIRLH
jgi:hypothetical protein